MSLNYPEIKQDPPVVDPPVPGSNPTTPDKPGNNSDPAGPVSGFDKKKLGKILGGVFGGLGGLAVIVIGTILVVMFLPFSIVVIAISLPVLLFKWLIGKLRTNVT